MPYWFFKNFKEVLTPVVASIFNRILVKASIPKQWRHAIITPIPKINCPKEYGDLRPISVTCLLSRVFERIVVRKYIMPCLPQNLLLDQFAFKLTGSTSAALVNMSHHITSMLETNNYVHCVSIDFTKAFDTVNHEILLQKLAALPIHQGIQSLISSFLFGRTQSTLLCGRVSAPVAINRSIIQGSGFGPTLYIIFKSDLKTLSDLNKLCKYADDTNLLVPEKTDIDITAEFNNIIQWTVSNKLALNKSKTKQIVFRRPSARLSILPAPVLDIEIVESLKLLGVFVSSTFNQAEHVNFVCCIANQRLYLLNILKQNGLNCNLLDCIFKSIVVSRVAYAVEYWGNFVTVEQQGKINKMLKKARRWGLCKKLHTFDEIREERMQGLFSKIGSSNHCLHHLLPPVRNDFYDLRERSHPYSTPRALKTLFKNSFFIRMLSRYYVV